MLQQRDRGSRAGSAAGLGPHAQVTDGGGPEAARWTAGTGPGVQRDERSAGCQGGKELEPRVRGNSKGWETPLLWESSSEPGQQA